LKAFRCSTLSASASIIQSFLFNGKYFEFMILNGRTL